MTQKRRPNYLYVWVIMVVALALRLWPLGASLDWSEAELAVAASRPLSQQLQIMEFLQPPLLHLLTFLAAGTSHAEWWLRLWGALIPGLLTIWGTYVLGKKLAGQLVGLTASLFLATSSFHLFYSDKLLPYSLAAMSAVWSWFFLLEAIRVGRDSYQIPKKHQVNKFFRLFPISRDFFLFLGCSIVGVYASYLYWFCLVAQVIYLLYRKNFRLAIYAMAIPVVSFLPWLPTLAAQWRHQEMLSGVWPEWSGILSFSLWKAPVLTFGKFIFGVVDLQTSMVYVVMSGIFAFLALWTLFARERQFYKRRKKVLLALIFFLAVPLILCWFINIFWSVITPSRLLFLLPAYYLFLSWLIFAERRQLPYYVWALLVLTVGLNLYGVGSFYWHQADHQEDWRRVVADMHERLRSNETVAIFAYPDVYPVWRWYDERRDDRYVTLTTQAYVATSSAQVQRAIQPAVIYQSAIVPEYTRALADPENLVPRVLEGLGFGENQLLCYGKLGCIRIYGHTILAEKREGQR